MPRAYLLALTVGSSLDQGTNNISLFQLVEQVNLPPNVPRPPGMQLPLEIHAYFFVEAADIGKNFEVRFALRSPLGLEAFTETTTHRLVTGRYRMKVHGLPFPAVLGHYELRIDFRAEHGEFYRDPLSYPVSFVEVNPTPPVTH
ncbi:MAG: hypothetical protein QM793_14680 [Muricomes sp.]